MHGIYINPNYRDLPTLLLIFCSSMKNKHAHTREYADIEVLADPRLKRVDKDREICQYVHPPTNALSNIDGNGALFLRTNLQIQGFLQEQADAIER